MIWDTQTKFTLANDRLHHNVDYTPYEGMNLSAWPKMVFSRGELVVADGECRARPGRGQFLPCLRRQPTGAAQRDLLA